MANDYERENLIAKWLRQDIYRWQVLQLTANLALPDCYVAAGFVRNLVWDHLHNKSVPTPLNDVDVIYFDSKEKDPLTYQIYESHLSTQMPEVSWQVRNQARMHIRNGDMPYVSSVDAMSYWVEKETAVGARLNNEGKIECIAAFGFESLFNLQITANPKRSAQTFYTRTKEKGWLELWPRLKLQPISA